MCSKLIEKNLEKRNKLNKLIGLILICLLFILPKLFIQAEDDFANDWSNEQIISITNQENSTLSHYLNKITLDATNFDFSVAQSDGADIRFTQDLSYYELPITITNNSSSTLTNKSIAITVTDTSVLSHLTVNGHDLRFFSTQQTNPYDEANSLSYWIDSIDISSSATIYVEIPTLTASADTTVYMYYGEQLAEPLTDQSWISSPGPVVNKSATLPTNWAYGSCVTANDGLIYCLGGNDSNWTDLNTIFAYNPTTDNVTTTSAVLPTGVSSWGDNCTLASNGKIYCFGGYSGASIDQIYSYDPVTDSSTTTVAVLPQAEYGVACATSGSYIYCFGGYDDTDYYSDILKYNPAIPNDNPVSVGNLSSESAQIDAVTGADGKIYLLGGIKKSSVTYSCSGAVPPGCFCFGPEGTCSVTETTYLETILQFDPTTNTMTTRSATLPQDRTAYSNTCALASDNNIYCLGGLENNTSAFTKNIYVYNPSGDTLTTSDQELPQAVAGHSCVKANNNNLYCLGGSIDTGTWAPNLNTISEFAESDYYATFPISFGAESIISTAQHNLAYWIESYDSTAQTATVWLDIPSLVASAVAEIKLYYGNAVASAISDQNKVNSLDSSVQKPNVIFDGDVITPTPGQVLTNCGTIDQSGNYYLSANLINRNINTCFTITANQVTLDCQGYQISGDDINNSIGIDFSQTSNVTINNCQLTDWTTGIFGRYVDYATLTNNQFSSLSGTNVLNVATGIYLTDWNADWSATGSLTNNNLIDQNQFSDIVGYGVILEGSVDDTISQNTFGTSLNNTGGRGQDHAILVKSDAQGITITNNTINRMGQIELRGCQDGVGTTLDDITISDNTISNSTNYGITFYDGISNSLIDNNTITGNSVLTDSQQGSLGGIYGEQSTSGACSSNVITTNTVSNNTISSADLFLSGPAIKLMYGDVFVVSDNNLQNSDDYLLDIRFSGSQSAQITDNQVSHGAGGIYLNGGVSQQITGNTIKNIVYYNDGAYGFLGDKNNGIKVQSIGSSSLISNNRISNTSNAGIAVLSSDQFTVSSNTIVSTRFAGILSNDSDNIIIDNNNISLVYQASGPDSLTRVGAISLGSATYNTVSNNKLFNNYQGITLRASDNNQITSNQIMNSWHYGMYLSNDSNTNNVLQSNFNCSNSTYDIYYQGGANSNSGSSNTCSSTYLWNDDGQSGCTNSCGSVFSLTDCQAISRPGIYTLQNDVSATGTCFTITADNVKIDGNDKTISYASSQSGYGISASDVEGLTIIDCQIEQTDSSVNGRGIYFSGISHSVISNNSLTNNSTGLYLINSTDNIIENNTVNSNQQGIYTDAQTITNRIKDNQVCYNTTADLQSNSNNTLLANTCDASTPTCADACAITGTTNQQSGTYIHSAQDIFQRDTISDNIILEDNKLSLAKDMTQPSQLATLNFTNSDFSRFRLSGDNVFLVNGDQQKLLSVDVSDSSSLQLLDTYTTSLNRADTIEIKGNYAYLAGCYQDGVTQDKLLAIDISNPSSPQLAYTLEDAVFCATDSYQQGDYLYVADQYVGLRVFDLSNPELPVQVNSSSPSFSPRAVSGINQHLYLIDYRSISSNDVYYLKLIDLSQPTNPQLLSSVPLTWLPTTLKVDPQEKYVLVGNASQSQLFSITYKNTITPISAQDSATINCVDAWQNYFFVGSSNQLSIYYPDATALSVYSDRQQTLSFPLSSSLADLQLTGQLASVDPIYTVKFSTDQRNLFYSTNQSFNAVGFDTYQSGSILSFTEDFSATNYRNSATTATWLGKATIPFWNSMDGTAEFDDITSNQEPQGSPTVLLDTQNNPMVVWTDDTTDYDEIYFTHWNGSAWTHMDGTPGVEKISNHDNVNSYFDSFQLDAQNYPAITWRDNSTGNGEIYFTHWNGSAWTTMDGTPGSENLSSNSGLSWESSIVFDSQNNPMVYWRDNTEANSGWPSYADLFFTHWNGSAWTTMDGTPGAEYIFKDNGKCLYPLMKFDSQDNPYAVWEDTTSGYHMIYFTHWNGSEWTNMDNTGIPWHVDVLSASAEQATQPYFYLDDQDNPNVFWFNCTSGISYAGPHAIHSTHWNGSAWTHMDGTTLGYEDITNGNHVQNWGFWNIVLNSQDNPTVVWTDNTTGNNEIYSTYWNGSDWTAMDGTSGTENLSNNNGSSSVPTLKIDSQDQPIVIWTDDTDGNSEIYSTHWNGSAWTAMDDTPGVENLSNNDGSSSAPTLKIDSQDQPIVIWTDDTDGNNEIYSTYWNGSDWTAMDSTSATENLSNNSTNSSNSQLYFDGNDYPLLFWDDDTNILFRKGKLIASAQAVSGQINSPIYLISQAKIIPTVTLNGQTINYHLSDDGGTTWQVATANQYVQFSSSENDLRWKAILNTNSTTVRPEINQVQIDYQSLAETIVSSLITPPEIGDWDKIEINNTLNDQDVSYQILDADSQPIPDSVLAGNSSGFSATNTITTIYLNNLSADTYPQIKLKTAFSGSSGTTVPEITNWQASWIKAKIEGNNQSNSTVVSLDQSGGQGTVNFDGTSSVGSEYTCQWDWNSDGVYDEDDPDCLTDYSFNAGRHLVTMKQTQGTNTAIDTTTFIVVIATAGSGGIAELPVAPAEETPTEALVPTTIQLTSPTNQVKATGEDNLILTATVFDQNGQVISNAAVNWQILTPGNLFPYGPADNGSLSVNNSLTNQQGQAVVVYTGGKSLGLIQIKATADSISIIKNLTLLRPLMKFKLRAEIIH